MLHTQTCTLYSTLVGVVNYQTDIIASPMHYLLHESACHAPSYVIRYTYIGISPLHIIIAQEGAMAVKVTAPALTSI